MNKLFLLLTLTWLCPSYSAASQGSEPPALDIPGSADLAFVPKGLAYITHIDDAILQKIGCKYTVSDSETALQLLKLLSAARDVPQDSLEPKQIFEIRNKIVFHFQDKKDISVEFSQKFLNQPYVKANWNIQPVLLRSEVVDEIRGFVNNSGFAQINKSASAPCDAL